MSTSRDERNVPCVYCFGLLAGRGGGRREQASMGYSVGCVHRKQSFVQLLQKDGQVQARRTTHGRLEHVSTPAVKKKPFTCHVCYVGGDSTIVARYCRGEHK